MTLIKEIPINNNLKEKILITGGSGLLAYNWALTMRDQYSIILGLHQKTLALPGIASQNISLESQAAIDSLLKELLPQLVIHTASLTNVEECEANPEFAHHVNVELSENIAKACHQHKVPLVHVSTDHLFSGNSKLVDENHKVKPLNTYARTKAEAEKRVMQIYPKALIIRTNFYGWGLSYRKSFSDIIIEALRAGKKITLFNDVFYTPILIEKLVLTVHELIELSACGIFNVVADDRISKYEFGMKIAEHFQLDGELIESASIDDFTSLTPRPHDMSLSNKKACNLLGKQIGGIDEQLQRLMKLEKIDIGSEVK